MKFFRSFRGKVHIFSETWKVFVFAESLRSASTCDTFQTQDSQKAGESPLWPHLEWSRASIKYIENYPSSKSSNFVKHFSLFSSVQSLSHVWLCDPTGPPCPSPTPGVYPNPCPIESVMPSNHLILCRPLLLLPTIPPSIRVFSHWVTSSHEVAKVLEFQLQHQSFQWTHRTDLL